MLCVLFNSTSLHKMKWTGIISMNHFQEITTVGEKFVPNNPNPCEAVIAICELMNEAGASLWQCNSVCAKTEPPAGFLEAQPEKRHYHYITDENPISHSAYNKVSQCVPSISVDHVRTLGGLLYWLEENTEEIKCSYDEDDKEGYEEYCKMYGC